MPSAMSKVDLSKRRRFQPPITTFFTSATEPVTSDTPAVSHHHHYAARTFSATPVVPAEVQSSLLSVGMRIRKSMADGHRTDLAKAQEKVLPPTVVAQAPSVQPYRTTHRHSELTPFSGEGRDEYLITDDGDAFSLPPSSQESNASFSGALGGQKRSLDVEDIYADEDDESDARDDTTVGRSILSPNMGQGRRILPMRSSKIQQHTMEPDDFEEATFLRRREEVDADDIRMYGA
ncbi:unnamed protein product [Penicillium olsonii]|nr:unnamed protein product [Penicillium olsonii]